MRVTIQLLVCLWCCFGAVIHAQSRAATSIEGPKDKHHVYLLIGQSNMAGRAPFTQAEAGVLARCFLFNAEDAWESARNPFNRYSTIRKDINMQKMNPGYGFAKTMTANDESRTIGIVANAKGGTKIEQWAKGSEFYEEAVRRARSAMKTGTLKGILWHQGEGNSRNPDAYLGQLEALILNLRKDLNDPNLPFVAGQVFYDAEKKPHTKRINEQIAKLPETVPNTGYVSAEGLTTFDNTHFDLTGMTILGQRYAEEMLTLQSNR